jgi:hypothetical protein
VPASRALLARLILGLSVGLGALGVALGEDRLYRLSLLALCCAAAYLALRALEGLRGARRQVLDLRRSLSRLERAEARRREHEDEVRRQLRVLRRRTRVLARGGAELTGVGEP